MARMSDNNECPIRDFSDSSQLINWVLDSGATCHMKPKVSGFIPGSLENTDKHVEVSYGNQVKTKQRGKSRINICDDNGDTFIATLHNILLESDLYGRIFSIIT